MKNKKEIIKILNLPKDSDWSDIYARLGELKAQSAQPHTTYPQALPVGNITITDLGTGTSWM